MKKLSFSIEKYELEEISNSQFAKLRLYICHDLDNKNGSYISLDSMKEAEKTLWNKPVIMKLNKFGTDFEEHETDVIVVGMIPQLESNIHYEQIGDRNYLVADAIIWKYYSSATLEIFERDETKGISMEIQVLEEHQRVEDGFVQIDSYTYLAVCLLGSKYETGMYRTTAQIVQFSKENTIDTLNKEWISFMNNEDKDKKISSSERLKNRKPKKKDTSNKQFIKEVQTALRDINNISEETVSHIKQQYTKLELTQENFSELGFSESEFMEIENFIKEVQEMAVGKENKAEIEEKVKDKVDGKDEMSKVDEKEEMAKVEDGKEEMAKSEDKEEEKEDAKEEKSETKEEEDKEDKEEMACKSEMSEDKKEEMSKEEEDFKAMYADLSAKFEALKEQMSEKDTALLSLNSEFIAEKEEKEKFKKELESLQSYKAEVEKAEKFEKMKDTFAVLTNVLSKEEIDEWKTKSEKYEDISLFEKEIKAFACDKLLKLKNTTGSTQFSKMAVNLDTTDESEVQDENVWTRIGKRVSK